VKVAGVCKIPDIRTLNPNYPNSNLKYPDPNYPITISNNNRKNLIKFGSSVTIQTIIITKNTKT
jgi:hypothetical protein